MPHLGIWEELTKMNHHTSHITLEGLATFGSSMYICNTIYIIWYGRIEKYSICVIETLYNNIAIIHCNKRFVIYFAHRLKNKELTVQMARNIYTLISIYVLGAGRDIELNHNTL